MKKEVKEKIKKFLEDRRLVINPKDIALIILEGEAQIPQEFWKNLGPSFSYFLLNDPYEYYNLEKQFIQAQKEDKIFLLEIKADPSNLVIQFLKQISHFGGFNLHDKRGNLISHFEVKPGSLVVIAQRKFIENNITYPRFYNIFDTALSIP
ncbi:MAG: hypothetical protein QW609_04505 [Candidatus Aenigmatarchaeota archaeon]